MAILRYWQTIPVEYAGDIHQDTMLDIYERPIADDGAQPRDVGLPLRRWRPCF
jgi:hypothetical protein